MLQKIFIILGLLLLTEFLLAIGLWTTLRSWPVPNTLEAGPSFQTPSVISPFLPPKSLKLIGPQKTWLITAPQLASWPTSDPPVTENAETASLTAYFLATQGRKTWPGQYLALPSLGRPRLNEEAVGDYLLKLSSEINQDPQDAKLIIENSQVTKFTPHAPGQTLNLAQARRLIQQAFATGTETLFLPVVEQAPRIRLGDLNNLGIRELLAKGQTDFSGSTPSRIQNIRVGTSRYRGVIIQRDEEFSFNKYLGPIDAAHGFLPELVIKPEGTVPEFGGGLCQVSSTAFRAAFYAGLPITQRRNHSYPVRYYEWISDDEPRAVGLDATIYPGAQDLRFINNTPGAILIWTEVIGKRVFFYFYGAPDGRKVVIDGPHPYDRRPDGAVKSKVGRTIVAESGESKQEIFNSVYVSPSRYPKVYEYPKPGAELAPNPSVATPPISNN